MDSHKPPPPGRVAVIVAHFPIRSETFVLRQLAGLIDRGWEVDIFPVSSITSDVIPEQFASYDLLGRIHDPQSARTGLGKIAQSLVAVSEAVGRSPSQAFDVLFGSGWGRRRGRLEVARLARALRKRGPYDILHCHFGPVGVMAAGALRLLGVCPPLSVVFHGFELSRRRALDLEGYSRLFRGTAELLPVSDRWRQRLLDLGADPERTRVHRMGVELGQWVSPPPPPVDELRLVSVCRLVEKKGIADALSAVEIARDRGLNLRYTVVGDGPLLDDYRRRVTERQLEGIVDFTGWADPAELPRRLAEAHVLLAPSVTAADGDQEGIPVSIMEAMAAARSVIATWHSGIPELVIDEETGFLVPERSPAELADRIERLARDPHLCTRFGEAARQRVASLHDQTLLDDDLSRQFQAMIARARSS